MKKMNNLKRSAGFTLIEISVVLVLLGIVAAIVAPRMIAKQNDAKAQNMLRLADSARNALSQSDLMCGTGLLVTGNTLPASGKTIEDALFVGDANIDPQYLSPTSTCTDRTGNKPMTDLVKKTATGYSLSGFPITLSDVSGYTGSVFTLVTESVLQSLLSTVSDTATVNAAGDSTGNRIRYSAPTSGKYTVTILSK